MSKRTIDELDAGASVNGSTELISKKKRKEKKEKKEKKDKKASSTGLASDVAPAEENVTEERKERKEKKKKEKKEKKEKEKNGIKSDIEQQNLPSEDEMAFDEPAAEEPKKRSKEARKAAKAAKKAAKTAKKLVESNIDRKPSDSELSKHSGSSTPASTVSSNPSISGAAGNYAEDAELAALPQSIIDGYLTKNFISFTDPLNAPTLRPITKFTYVPINDEKQRKSFLDFTSSFAQPTPIQAAVWPYLLSGRDCIGVAETGSGKTLAFGVPALRRICFLSPKERKGVRVLVISPTRELAMQSHEHLNKLAGDVGLTAVCVYGGVPKEEQRKLLKKATIVVATPGRLNDLINEGAADLSSVDYLVLDEADRMLDKGFEEDIKKIIGAIPKNGRQTLMFTATWPSSVRDLAATFMNSPVHFTIGDNPTGDLRANVRIVQTVEVIDHRSKEQRLVELLRQHHSAKSKGDKILVFCLYKKEATRVENFLKHKGFKIVAIHGDLSQGQRTQALQSFKDGACPIMIATDVAARGLDIPKVKLVINVTFPLTIEDYVHRIGRTGRAGETGSAITFFTEHDKAHSGALINVLKAAGQNVPESLLKFGTTVKKKEHSIYGAFYKDTEGSKQATKIKFDN
ncbi:P-loop containing nucleoside triphosphate hydrolase protein [Kalaharituber pfeilii]|nr:P-loop containing nucleoside triphosphate hydrolase protein [Kalaharituber pfeilii]